MKVESIQSTPPKARWNNSFANLPALSIRQPYAWLIANGVKDIENRSRRTNFRGKFLIHAALNTQNLTEKIMREIEVNSPISLPEEYYIGGIIGIAEIVDCVRDHDSPWKHDSEWGWVVANPRPLSFLECKGALGFFRPSLTR